MAGFQSDLRISHRWLLVVPVVLGILLFFLSESPAALLARTRLQDLALLSLLIGALGWGLAAWRWQAGAWFCLAGLATVIYLAHAWLAVPSILALLALPPAMAMASLGFAAGLIAAVIESVWLGIPLSFVSNVASRIGVIVDANEGAPFDAGSILSPGLVALVAIWATLGLMYVVLASVQRVAHWAWEYYELAQVRLEEARERKAAMEQVLADLAHTNLQLSRLNMLAQGLRQTAEDARSAKEEFVANVSHELRTPLNMITGFSETILESPETYGERIPPKLLSDLTVIHRNAEHLSALIDDVLDLGQIDAEQMAMTKEHVQFPTIVEEAVTAVRPLLDAKGLYLTQEIPDDLPRVFCDHTRIREVLLNLLSNAGRFTDQGGIHLCVSHTKEFITVSVADSGSGIAAEDLNKLFQPFQQLDRSARRRHTGTGLGLSISKRFIELHNGQIWVESEPGAGTTFFFRLPLAPPTPLSNGFFRWLTPDWEYVQRSRAGALAAVAMTPRFVVLEAGGVLCQLLNRYWHEAEVVAVDDLQEAVEEVRRVPTQALLVNLSPVSQAMQQLDAIHGLPNGTPAIICSIPDTSKAMAEYGRCERLVKPVSRHDLLDKLARLEVTSGTILVVDDDPDALQLFGRMLMSAGHGYRVLQARNGHEALAILQEHRADAILLDLVMPNMDGFRFLDMRSHNTALGEIPIVIVSAQDPTGRPILSSMLAVTQGQGLSAQRLLISIASLSRILSPAGQLSDSTRLEMPPD